MKKMAIVLSTLLVYILGISTFVYAQDETGQQKVEVTATRKYDNSGLYRKELINKTPAVSLYVDDITLKDIKNLIATKDDVKTVAENGYTLTLQTVITPLLYKDAKSASPEIKENDPEYENVLSFDISFYKVLSEDTEGEIELSRTDVHELPIPATIQLGVDAFDPATQTIDKCSITYVHNGVTKVTPVVYNEDENTFVFSSREFSNYFLYFTLKDKEAKHEETDPVVTPVVTPVITPAPAPTPVVTPTEVVVRTVAEEQKSGDKYIIIMPNSRDSSSSKSEGNTVAPTPVPTEKVVANNTIPQATPVPAQTSKKTQVPASKLDKSSTGDRTSGLANVPESKYEPFSLDTVGAVTPINAEDEKAEEVDDPDPLPITTSLFTGDSIKDVNAVEQETPVWLWIILLILLLIILIGIICLIVIRRKRKKEEKSNK